jgi:hypothetical protein
MNTAPQIERRKDYRGRALFVVAGTISTYDRTEADTLNQTGILELACPLARTVASYGEPLAPMPSPLPVAPNGRGVLSKFDWE